MQMPNNACFIPHIMNIGPMCVNYITASTWDGSHWDASNWNASYWHAEIGPRATGTRLVGMTLQESLTHSAPFSPKLSGGCTL